MTDPEDRLRICDKRRAILDGKGHMLVNGGPGSGKTTIALLKARRSVLNQLKPEQSVLFLSFSNAAIRRIQESAGNILTPEIGSQVDTKTYHSFAWDILRSHGYLLSSRRRLSIVVAQDAAVIRAGMEDDDWAAEEERLFLEEGRTTYDQLTFRAAELLERSAAIRKCFNRAHPLILVDEFQDTDKDQWRLVRALAEDSEVIALGDAEQRIYAWRKGVSNTRLQDFAEVLKAKRHDFGNENNRSPATGIAGFARSLLSPKTLPKLPKDIEFMRCKQWNLEQCLRIALIRLLKETAKRAGRNDPSLAVATRSRAAARGISDSLAKKVLIRGNLHGPISHDVMFDQMTTALAARVIAYIMASKGDPASDRLAGALERIGNVFRSSGNKTAIKKSEQLANWAGKCRDGRVPKTKCVRALTSLFCTVEHAGFSGSPTQDWRLVLQTLVQSEVDDLKRIGDHARFLRHFRRGSEIESRLSALWEQNGSYSGAEAAVDAAIRQNQLTDSQREASSICVMTMHQLKGREFDAVLLVECEYHTFLGKDSEPPYLDTRRLLQVSLTRARHFVCILSATSVPTLNVILSG